MNALVGTETATRHAHRCAFDRAVYPLGTPVERALLMAAMLYLALIPVAAMAAARSIAFATSALLALVTLWQARRGSAGPVPSPGRALAIAVAVMVAWHVASLAWSVRPAYSLAELRGELMWNTLTMVIFYVAAGVPRAWPLLTTTALAGLAVATLVSLADQLNLFGWNGSDWYGSSGFFSTYLVLSAPIVLSLTERSNRGWAGAPVAALALLALTLVAARHTDNRMVWIALAVVFAMAAALGALRWRATLMRSPWRWALALAALALALAGLFVDTAREKARKDFPPHTSIAQTFAEDPRLPLWESAREKIRERPLVGYGLGRAIVSDDLRATLHDPLLLHAHNMFVSQWLQTGAIGLAALLLLLFTLAGRYVAFFRASDPRVASVGLVGLALIAGFIVKNLTDDFLYRSNAREFWALNALLIGWGIRALRAARA